jgi:hypothetical protein
MQPTSTAYNTAGAAVNSCVAERDTAFRNLNNELASIIEVLNSVENRLLNFRERTLGSNPTTDGKGNPPRPVANGHIAAAAERLEVIKDLANSLDVITNIIEDIG